MGRWGRRRLEGPYSILFLPRPWARLAGSRAELGGGPGIPGGSLYHEQDYMDTWISLLVPFLRWATGLVLRM